MTMFNNDKWARDISIARKNRELSYRDISREMGISHASIQSWEVRSKTPNAGMFLATCKFLNLDPRDYHG